MAVAFEEAVYDKLALFEYILVVEVDDGHARALVDDAGKKGVVASHGNNAAVDTGGSCDDMMFGLKQSLLLERCYYLQ